MKDDLMTIYYNDFLRNQIKYLLFIDVVIVPTYCVILQII